MTSTATDPAAAVAALSGAAIDTADSTRCAELLGEVRRVRGWLDAREAEVTSRLNLLHTTAGAPPADDVHAKCGGVSSREGKRKGRRSKTIEKAPGFGDALAAGEIGAEHVDALASGTDKLDDTVKASLFDLADELLNDAKGSSPEAFARSVRDMARLLEHEAGIDRDRQQRRDSHVKIKANQASGMYRIHGELHPELGHLIQRTLERHVAAIVKAGIARGDREFVDRTIDRGRLMAEALGELLSGGHQSKRPAEVEIIALVDCETLLQGMFHPGTVCETSDGAPVPPVVAQRWMCNATITPVIVDANGNPFNMGRQIRTANRAQRRALRAMYRTCSAHGCDTPFDQCEIHHVNPWEAGGLTDLDNMIPVCSRHHDVFHADGWTLHLAPDRTLTITQPDGTHHASCVPDIPPQRRARSDAPPGQRRTAA